MSASIEDHFAIQDLFTRYATALDSGDVEGIVSCFTEDAALESPVVGVKAGMAEIRDFAERFSRFQARGNQLRHVLSNLAVAVDGDSARATCYLVNILTSGGKTVMAPPRTLRLQTGTGGRAMAVSSSPGGAGRAVSAGRDIGEPRADQGVRRRASLGLSDVTVWPSVGYPGLFS